jgi:hypothetical protein
LAVHRDKTKNGVPNGIRDSFSSKFALQVKHEHKHGCRHQLQPGTGTLGLSGNAPVSCQFFSAFSSVTCAAPVARLKSPSSRKQTGFSKKSTDQATRLIKASFVTLYPAIVSLQPQQPVIAVSSGTQPKLLVFGFWEAYRSPLFWVHTCDYTNTKPMSHHFSE